MMAYAKRSDCKYPQMPVLHAIPVMPKKRRYAKFWLSQKQAGPVQSHECRSAVIATLATFVYLHLLPQPLDEVKQFGGIVVVEGRIIGQSRIKGTSQNGLHGLNKLLE